MINKFKYILCYFILMGTSCTKEIQVDLPDVEEKLVVDGYIETGANPIIRLSKTTGFFDPLDFSSVAATIINNATITISNGTVTRQMLKICTQDLDNEQLIELSISLNIDSSFLQDYNICMYTDPMIGEENKSYTVNINWEGKSYQSTTTIPYSVPLDSTWFEIDGDLDSLGFIWSTLSDPAGEYNGYQWMSKRISKFKYGEDIGKVKDDNFLPPDNSMFDDEFFDGITFNFNYDRHRGDRTKTEEDGVERARYKKGDTVVVRFASIDQATHDFLDDANFQSETSTSPFANPINVSSNISNGALGLWGGYSYFYDTVILIPQ